MIPSPTGTQLTGTVAYLIRKVTVSAGNLWEITEFGSMHRAPISVARLCSFLAGSGGKREKPVTGHQPGIPASIFQSFLEFFGRNQSVLFHLGIIVITRKYVDQHKDITFSSLITIHRPCYAIRFPFINEFRL
jgi:hypothetical protein